MLGIRDFVELVESVCFAWSPTQLAVLGIEFEVPGQAGFRGPRPISDHVRAVSLGGKHDGTPAAAGGCLNNDVPATSEDALNLGREVSVAVPLDGGIDDYSYRCGGDLALKEGGCQRQCHEHYYGLHSSMCTRCKQIGTMPRSALSD